MFRTCDKHDDCIVIHQQLFNCPVCNEIDKLKDEINQLEDCLDEYEEKK